MLALNEERKRALFERQEGEEDLKRDRKQKGRGELVKWAETMKRDVGVRKNTNKEGEKQYHEMVQTQRRGPNPWERVVSNCEMNSASYVGGADVSRMR